MASDKSTGTRAEGPGSTSLRTKKRTHSPLATAAFRPSRQNGQCLDHSALRRVREIWPSEGDAGAGSVRNVVTSPQQALIASGTRRTCEPAPVVPGNGRKSQPMSCALTIAFTVLLSAPLFGAACAQASTVRSGTPASSSSAHRITAGPAVRPANLLHFTASPGRPPQVGRGTTPVTFEDLLSAPVPSLRGNPAGRLVNGKLPVPVPGSVELMTGDGGAPPVYGDLNGDHVADAAAVVGATSGAGGLDESVELYTDGSHLRRLGGFGPADLSRTYHAWVLAMAIRHEQLLIDWAGENPGSISYWSAHVSWTPHGLRVQDLKPGTGAADTGLWSDRVLTLTPEALGAVRIGMTLTEATNASGMFLQPIGDGLAGPSATAVPRGYLALQVLLKGATATPTVGCLVAIDTGPTRAQRVRTPQGFFLGNSVAQLKAIYGAMAEFVPAPKVRGMTDFSGYVVHEKSGDLVFIGGRSGPINTMFAGPPGLTPNSC